MDNTHNQRHVVSVVMAVYNEQDYLKDTIESILAQTFKDFEFIIVDDSSTDKTNRILDYYRQKDNRIKILTNNINKGCGWSLNKGIQSSKGKYIAIIDAADSAYPFRLEKQVNFLAQNRSIYLLGTYAYWINSDKQIIGQAKRDTNPHNMRQKAFRGCSAIHPTIMARKELFEQIGLYNAKLKHGRDFDLCIRTLKAGFEISNIPEFLMRLMQRDEGMTYANLKRAQISEFKIRLKNFPHFLGLWNGFYLLVTLLGCFLPTFVLHRLMDRVIKRGRVF